MFGSFGNATTLTLKGENFSYFCKLNGDNWNWLSFFFFIKIMIFSSHPAKYVLKVCFSVCMCVTTTTFYMFWMSWSVASISSWSILFFARSFNNSSVEFVKELAKHWMPSTGYYNIKSKHTHQNKEFPIKS